MRAFIIRPFGVKEGVDFDAVDERLIGPALDAQEPPPEGRTTGDIVEAGNIRTSMFEQILVADLVIADVSIHNANVFYELGIRHALRDRRTILIRSQVEGHDVPFDLRTDRYVEYDHTAPEHALDQLTEAIRQTIASDQPDSPVMALMPNLKPLDPKELLVVPPAFSEEVDLAAAHKDCGRLRLLAEEAAGLTWEVAALRLVGKAQFGLRDWEAAKSSLEAVTALFPTDVDANTLLGTVHQRLDKLDESAAAIDRVLGNQGVTPHARAEARALVARNVKSKWEADWCEVADGPERQIAALRSGHLEACTDVYVRAFAEDRNHVYSGLNAFAMLHVTLELARAHPDVWAEGVDDDDEDDTDEGADRAAARALRRVERRAGDVGAALKLAIESSIERLEREESDDLIWAKVSRADLRFLTSDRPASIAQTYRKVLADAEGFVADAARKQVVLYSQLGLFADRTAAVMEAIGDEEDEPADTAQGTRVIVFTGHRLDAPDRPQPRFPAASEDTARELIRAAVVGQQEKADGAKLLGICGGASGGDILFHEVCAELGIETRMFLALPKDDYVAASVTDAGGEWVNRFNDLHATTEPTVIHDHADLPGWIRTKREYTVWERSNLWMLHTAFARGGRVALVALWNGAPGDGPGGTEDMVERAKQRSASVEIIDATQLLV